ncbi:MAG: hypothetical protein GXP41_02600 [Chloroflexi bacterium]|nr:hypothetical protein [Chloroflexota bacterium]
MNLNIWLPFPSALITFIFGFFVFKRYRERGGTHLLLWGIGLVMYGLGSISEAYNTAVGWNPLVFRVWYLFGAMLVAAWLGQGTVALLWKRWNRPLLILLTLGSLFGLYQVATAKLDRTMLADEVIAVSPTSELTSQQLTALAAAAIQTTALGRNGKVDERRLSPLASTILGYAQRNGVDVPTATEATVDGVNVQAIVDGKSVLFGRADWLASQGVDITTSGTSDELILAVDGQQAGTLDFKLGRELHGHAIISPGVRVLTPIFNIYGLLTLVGGAIYSAWIFLRKRIMPNRVIGNVLIAAGALMPAIGGILSRFGFGGYLYLGELLGAILMFIGFLQATSEAPERVTKPATEPVT